MERKYIVSAARGAGAVLFVPVRLLLCNRFFIPEQESLWLRLFSLIVERDNGIAPVLTMISGASSSVDLGTYELDDMRIEWRCCDEVRGVAVRVILSGGYKGATSTMNASAIGFGGARRAGAVCTAYFSLTHEKSLSSTTAARSS